ncbi:pentapeptide repeat-containing protein [Haloarculaceae archaeon H-GB11]|nr:pentapeptide repeat-containing protein [Haloarculaceae archaeon H-GB11]
MSDADQERCDYRLTVGQVHDDIEAEPCERPVWEDHDRCFWHAPVEEKTSKMLDEAEVGNGDDLDGAYLREAVFATEDLFRGRSLIGADFAGADVKGTDFSEADLTLANMSDVSAINADFEGRTSKERSSPTPTFDRRRSPTLGYTRPFSPTCTSAAGPRSGTSTSTTGKTLHRTSSRTSRSTPPRGCIGNCRHSISPTVSRSWPGRATSWRKTRDDDSHGRNRGTHRHSNRNSRGG